MIQQYLYDGKIRIQYSANNSAIKYPPPTVVKAKSIEEAKRKVLNEYRRMYFVKDWQDVYLQNNLTRVEDFEEQVIEEIDDQLQFDF